MMRMRSWANWNPDSRDDPNKINQIPPNLPM
jgi:hypothetical protein